MGCCRWRDDVALAVLLGVGDADSVVDLLVEPEPVVNDALVINEVITTYGLEHVLVGPLVQSLPEYILNSQSNPGELDL